MTGLNSPTGMAVKDGQLYIADTDALVRVPYKDGDTRITAKPELVVKLSGPVTSGVVGGLACYGALAALPPSAPVLAVALCGGAVACLGSLYLIEGPRLLREMRGVSSILSAR